jgi:hypothetical protein
MIVVETTLTTDFQSGGSFDAKHQTSTKAAQRCHWHLPDSFQWIHHHGLPYGSRGSHTVGEMPMMRSIKFNTNRGYGPEGQPIEIRMSFSKLMFNDEARGITGVIPAFRGSLTDESDGFVQREVMVAYDHGFWNDAPLREWEEMAK